MVKKVLFVPILVVLFGVSSTRSYAVDITVQLPGSPTPVATVEPTASPAPTVAPTASAAPSVQPTVTPVTSPSPIPSVTPAGTVAPSASVVASPVASATPSSAPQVGGVTPATSTPAPSVSPSTSPSPTPTASPKVTIERILNTETKKSKPIIQDIGDNAYNTLLDSPLSFLVQDKDRDYYHPHGLSQSSTKILLSSGFTFSIIGLLMMYPRPLQNVSTRIRGASQLITELF